MRIAAFAPVFPTDTRDRVPGNGHRSAAGRVSLVE